LKEREQDKKYLVFLVDILEDELLSEKGRCGLFASSPAESELVFSQDQHHSHSNMPIRVLVFQFLIAGRQYLYPDYLASNSVTQSRLQPKMPGSEQERAVWISSWNPRCLYSCCWITLNDAFF